MLITGASGGVGGAAIHLAKAMGHIIVGLSRDAEKSKRLLVEGADFMFDPTDTNWRKKMHNALGQKEVDLAIDNISSTLFNDVVDSLGYAGKVSCVGRLAGPVPQFNTASLSPANPNWRRTGGRLHTRPKSRLEEDRWFAEDNRQKPLVDSIFPFEKLMDAFEHLAKGPMGKVLLRVSQ